MELKNELKQGILSALPSIVSDKQKKTAFNGESSTGYIPSKEIDDLEEKNQESIEVQVKLYQQKPINYSESTSKRLSEFHKRLCLMEIINHQIYQITDRNQAYSAKYSFFNLLLYLTLKELEITIAPSQRICSIMKYIFTKMQKQQMKLQLKCQDYYGFFSLILRKQKLSVKQIHEFMRNFLRLNRYQAVTIFPYYFNLFALVVNKQIIFNGEQEGNLISYTIDFEHQNRYCGNFTRENIYHEWREVQVRTINKYHSQEL